MIYTCGLRITEATTLRRQDIDVKRMVVIIPDSKFKKTREVPLPSITLKVLTNFWLSHKNPVLIFPTYPRIIQRAHTTDRSMSSDSAERALKKVKIHLNIKKNITPHTLRHCYATHLLDAGINIRTVQRYLGHADVRTTCLYLHVTKKANRQAVEIMNDMFGGLSNE